MLTFVLRRNYILLQININRANRARFVATQELWEAVTADRRLWHSQFRGKTNSELGRFFRLPQKLDENGICGWWRQQRTFIDLE
jgi:hypothetical protein